MTNCNSYQNERKTTALTHMNFATGLIGDSSAFVAL